MKSKSVILAGMMGGLALVGMPETAAAQPAHCPPGHQMKGMCSSGSGSARFHNRDNVGARDAYEQGYRDALDDLRVGDRLSRDQYRLLDRSLYRDRYGRPLDDRYYYADVNGEQLLIEAATGAIVDFLLR